MARAVIILNWLIALAWAGVIFGLSSVGNFSVLGGPAGEAAGHWQGTFWISASVHLFLYAILTWFLCRAFLSSGFSFGLALWYAFLMVLFYAAIDEYHQSFVPGREARVSDWLVDVLGAYLVISFYTYQKRRGKKL